MKQMTFDEYDAMVEKFATMRTEAKLWPTCEQIEEIMEEDPEKYISFAVFLHEKGQPPKDEAEKNAKKRLFQFINDHLELVDELSKDEE